MRAELIIKNGIVFDPSLNLNKKVDLILSGGRIAPFDSKPEKIRDILDADGCYVIPGLIDMHSHVFTGGSELGTPADRSMLPMGVTSTVDMGSAGYLNFPAFMEEAARSEVKQFFFVNVTPYGPISLKESEYADPALFDEDRLQDCINGFPNVLGLKIRMGRETIRDLGIKPLERTIEIAEKLHTRVSVHVSGSTVPVREMARLLRRDDMFCHVFQDRGDSIFDEKGNIYPEILNARERGVVFDVAHGLKNASDHVARNAILAGFLPDFIGTDLSSLAAYRGSVLGQTHIMSKYMALGLSFSDVVRMTTSDAASWLSVDDTIGHIKEGYEGTITVIKIKETNVTFQDYHGEQTIGNKLLIPMLTVIRGKVVYRNPEFGL